MHNPIILNCYTYDKSAYNDFPIQPMKRQTPSWWRDLPSMVDDIKTMKHCVGFNEYFAQGFTVPLWSDFNFSIGATLEEGVTCDNYSLAVHPTVQRGEYLPESRYQNLKIIPPWFVSCEEDVRFLFNQNTWGLDNPEDVIIPPGVVEFKLQKSVNINLFMLYNGIKRDVKLKAGTCLVNIAPLSDRKIEIHNHLIDESKWVVMNNTSFYNAKRCPFHKS